MDFNGRSGEMGVFVSVAQEGSLSAAARTLGLTPSAVSRIIARTEQRLGTRLLLRTTRSLTFTAEGEAFLRGARRILADMAEVEEAIADQGVPRGDCASAPRLVMGGWPSCPWWRHSARATRTSSSTSPSATKWSTFSAARPTWRYALVICPTAR